MTRSRIIWFALTGLVVIIFLAGIPIDVYEKHEMLYSFLGAILFFGCLFMALGDFKSIYEITETTAEHTDDQLRKWSPIAVLPAFVMIFVFVLSQSSRVSADIKQYAVLTKGTITGGHSTTSSRRGRTSTTYDIYVSYTDSSKQEYQAELDVSGSEFNDLYEGAVIDIVYSSKHPSLAKPILNLEEMGKYRKIATGDISVDNMIAILEEKVKPDSVKDYLNKICYEWRVDESGDYYINDQRKIAIAVALEQGKVFYIRETLALAIDQERLFEKSAEAYGFKKREVNDGQKTITEYYTDDYLITKERKSIDGQDADDFLQQKALDVYAVIKNGVD